MEIYFTARKDLHLLAIAHFLVESKATPYVGWESKLIEVGELVRSKCSWISVLKREVLAGGGNGCIPQDLLENVELKWLHAGRVLGALARQAHLIYSNIKEALNEFLKGGFSNGCVPDKAIVVLSYWSGLRWPESVVLGRDEDSLGMYVMVNQGVTPQEVLDSVIASIIKQGLIKCFLGGKDTVDEVVRALAPGGHLSKFLGLVLGEPLGNGRVWNALRDYVEGRKFNEVDLPTFLSELGL